MESYQLLSRGLDRDIAETHARFLAAMNSRLPRMPLESKERYFAILTALVGKLERAEKPLREILHEMMAEAGSYVVQELSTRR